MRILGTPALDYLPAAAALVVTAIFLASAYQYAPDSRLVPVMVGWGTIGLVSLDLASRTQTGIGRLLLRMLNPAAEHRPGGDGLAGRQLTAIAWVAGCAGAMALIGVLAAVPLYVFASMRFRGRRSYRLSLGAAIVAILVIWALFTLLLRQTLYPGLLFAM